MDFGKEIALRLGNANRCEHEWRDGLCVKCLCPGTAADTDRALAALDERMAQNG